MKQFPAAKIVVVIDTHSVENGAFVWTSETGTGKNPCFMLEVSFWYFVEPFRSRPV